MVLCRGEITDETLDEMTHEMVLSYQITLAV